MTQEIMGFENIARKVVPSSLVCRRYGENGSDLTLYQMTKFRLFQTERVCKRQFQV